MRFGGPELQTATSGSSGLRYDLATNQYVYVWKTSNAMAGRCYALILTLYGSHRHRAIFVVR